MNSTSTDTSNSNSSVMSGGDGGFGLGRIASVSSAMNQPDQNLQIASWLITDMLTNVTKVCEAARLPTCKDDNNNMQFFGGSSKKVQEAGGSMLPLALLANGSNSGSSGLSSALPLAMLTNQGKGHGRGLLGDNGSPMNMALMLSMLGKDKDKKNSNFLLPALLLQGRDARDPNTMMLLSLAKLKSCVDNLTEATLKSGAADLMAIPVKQDFVATNVTANEDPAAVKSASAALGNISGASVDNSKVIAFVTSIANNLLYKWRVEFDKKHKDELQGGGRRRRKGACSNTKKKSTCSRRKNCNWSKGHKRRGSRRRVSGSCKKSSKRRSRSRRRR